MIFYMLLWIGALYRLPMPGKFLLVMATGVWILFCHLVGEDKKRWEEGHPDEVHPLDVRNQRPYPPVRNCQ